MVDVTIITVNFNTAKFIKLCVKSIMQNTIMSHRLVVVDNGSSDESLPYLEQLATRQKLILVKRKVGLSAAEHGNALDHVLYHTKLVTTPLICTIDSDAFAAQKGWLTFINEKRSDAFGAGYEHFRNERYLHPACMMVDYRKLRAIGDPSFALAKIKGQFYDTGILVSEVAIKHGHKLIGIKNMQSVVPHRWCATRVHKVSGDQKLDNSFTRDEFNAVSNKWFSRPDVRSIMQK